MSTYFRCSGNLLRKLSHVKLNRNFCERSLQQSHTSFATIQLLQSVEDVARRFSSSPARFSSEALSSSSSLPSRQNSVIRQQQLEEGSSGRISITFETGKLAKLASGAVVASVGGTSVLVTAVSSAMSDGSKDFLPLQVDYREKQYAAGKIPNTFMRREGAPKEREILCSRVIDRSIRPLFPKGFFYDTQINANVLSSDGEHDPDILAVNAASAALSISSIPWNGPIGAVRVGRVNGEFVVNPTMTQLVESDLNIVYACTKDKTLMIEAQAREISNEDFSLALRLAHAEAVKLIEPQLRLAAMSGLEKREVAQKEPSKEMMERVRDMASQGISDVFGDPSHSKQDRGVALSRLEESVREQLREAEDLETLGMLPIIMANLKKEVVRTSVFAGLPRVDGRDQTTVRQLSCEAGTLPCLHGSSLFSRGNTQVLCTVTIGPPDDAQRLDSLVGPTQKRFMVHYSFPGYSINEVKPERGGLNRREVGHGTLAEKALVALLPPDEDFLYSVRLTSEVLGSDGSSSMATVCGGSMALMDAGVELREHVAGVSMGLLTELDGSTKEIKDYRLLTDILGLEDYLGDMDFKIAGSRRGITAVQLDIKLPGVPLEILCEALQPAHDARCRILDAMAAEIHAPRSEQRENTPRVGTLTIEKDNIGRLIGPQGSNIKHLQRVTGARLSVADTGVITIFARDQASYENAREMVESSLGKDIEVGSTYVGTVVAMKEFGAFVELEGGIQGLLHISELDHLRVARVDDIVALGESLPVVCIGRDFRGNVKLSRKALLPPPSPQTNQIVPPGPPLPAYTTSSPPTSPTLPPGSTTTHSNPSLLKIETEGASYRRWTAIGQPESSSSSSTPMDDAREGPPSWLKTSGAPRPRRELREKRVSGGEGEEKDFRDMYSLLSHRRSVESEDRGSRRMKVSPPERGGHDLVVGQDYFAKVKDVRMFGALVELSGGQEGLVRFEEGKGSEGSDLTIGQEIRVKCVNVEGGTRPKFALGSG